MSIIKINLKTPSFFKTSKPFFIEPEFKGEKKVDEISIQLFQYDEGSCEVNDDVSPELSFEFVPGKVNWLNFHGVHEVALIQTLSKKIDAHPLLVRDILNTQIRSKVDEYENHIFLVTKSPVELAVDEFEMEQISFILGKDYVISLQERVGDHFEHIRERLIQDMGIIRKKEADFLLFLLIDAIIENYFEVIANFESQLDALEVLIKKSPEPRHLDSLENLKKILTELNRKSRPLLQTINLLENVSEEFIRKQNKRFFSQLKEKLLGLIDLIDSYSQKAEGLDNIFYSIQGHRMNEIMKVLTIVSSIFIPLTFLAGIYGMNFEYIPELRWKYSYFLLLGTMIMIFIGMVIFFRRKRWF